MATDRERRPVRLHVHGRVPRPKATRLCRGPAQGPTLDVIGLRGSIPPWGRDLTHSLAEHVDLVAEFDLPVGSVRILDGRRFDRKKSVRIEGDRLASRDQTIDAEGTMGFRETLYYTTDRRLLVHVEHWSTLGGRMSTYSIVEIDGSDLAEGGRFEVLGRDAWAWLRG